MGINHITWCLWHVGGVPDLQKGVRSGPKRGQIWSKTPDLGSRYGPFRPPDLVQIPRSEKVPYSLSNLDPLFGYLGMGWRNPESLLMLSEAIPPYLGYLAIQHGDQVLDIHNSHRDRQDKVATRSETSILGPKY